MDLRIYQEDGHGNAVDEHGNEPVEMEVDVDGYPLADTVDFDTYMEFKPSEKPKASTKANKKVSAAASGPVSYYKKHGDDVKGHFFYLVYEEGQTARKAGKQLGIARRTAYDWLKRGQDMIVEAAESRDGLETKTPEKKAGRPALLNEDHKNHLEETFIDHPSATLDQAIESLTSQFSDLKVTKTTVYNFMTEKCALSFKKAHFHSKKETRP
jgi:transposase